MVGEGGGGTAMGEEGSSAWEEREREEGPAPAREEGPAWLREKEMEEGPVSSERDGGG